MKHGINSNFACVKCRKVFKKRTYNQEVDGSWTPIDHESTCPQCGAKMYETGTAFKAPKMTDKRGWERLVPLFESGYRFNPGFGSPIEPRQLAKPLKPRIRSSEFRKPARKRNRDA